MPQATAAATTKSKKKKGHAPAHQNAIAFHHNPKSKKTAHILASPIQHVCQKCKEKLEWRKQYRKYKPLTQPSKCNACGKRNVLAAYHTLCADCSCRSDKAVALLRDWNESRFQQGRVWDTEENEQEENDEGGPEQGIVNDEATADENVQAEPLERDATTTAATEPTKVVSSNNTKTKRLYTRVCAICVKEPALFGDDDDDQDDASKSLRRLKLREVKTLERQQERASQKPRRLRTSSSTENDNNEDNGSAFDDDSSNDGSDDDDEDDPFLIAVGGADKLAVGEAYQQRMLEHEQQQQHAVSR